MAEIAPSGGSQNRLFIVIALGLVGLLLIGIIALAAYFFLIRPILTPAVAPTRLVSVTTLTPVNIAQATAAPANTDTPEPTATSVINTPVIAPSSPVATSPITATQTITGTPGAGGTALPKTGLGDDLLLLAGGVVLVLIIFAARRARATGAA